MPMRSRSTLGTELPPVAAGQRPVIWSIAGADLGGDAGLQADLKALQAFGVHGCVVSAEPLDAQLDAQLRALAQDMPPKAIKTGLLVNVDTVRVVCQWIDRLRGQGFPVAVVVDPVLGPLSADGRGASDAVVQAYVQELLPRATLVSLNRSDAARLVTAMGLDASLAVPAAAAALAGLGQGKVSIVITDDDTPAHNVAGPDSPAADWLHCPQATGWLSVPRVDMPHHQSTRCTFASTAAAALASGYCVADAVVLANMAKTHLRPDFAQHVANLPTFTLPGATVPVDRHAVQPFAPLSNPALGVYAVVDSADWVRRVLDYGIRTVQLRIKDPAEPTLAVQIAESIATARATPGAQLFINDHWQLALQHGAYGVHLGQEDLEQVDLGALQKAGVRLGLSTHSYWEVARAWALRPSYIACGPIFATQSKDMPWIPQGLDNLRYWAGLLPLPVVGIAGIDVHNMADVAATGVASGAVISAITKADDPAQACTDLMAAFAR